MSATASPLGARERRRALGLGHVNAAFWAAGNALTTGSLVSYLARDLGAQGLAPPLAQSPVAEKEPPSEQRSEAALEREKFWLPRARMWITRPKPA